MEGNSVTIRFGLLLSAFGGAAFAAAAFALAGILALLPGQFFALFAPPGLEAELDLCRAADLPDGPGAEHTSQDNGYVEGREWLDELTYAANSLRGTEP